jgi:3-hydroxyacyl-CoA dehydrogenase
VGSTLEEAVNRRRIDTAAAAAARSLVTGAVDFAALADADLVIEAVFEQMQVKQSVFAQLGRICRPGAVLATNTSTLDVDEIAAASGRAADVVGMHFFSPAHIMRLVEIIRARSTSAEALGTAASVTKRLGKIGVVVGNCFGFVGNRMLYAYGREKELLLLEGVPPERIDGALESFGMAMGPNAVGDMAGIDIGVNARRAWRDRPNDPLYYRVSDLLVEQGRLGQKSGRGFYRYDNPDRRRASDSTVVDLIQEEARRLGVAPRVVTDDEIIARCVLALVNEAARILDAGIAEHAIDIDVIWCNGYGFPRTLGGPLYYADCLGLPQVLSRIEQFAGLPGGGHWVPAPLLLRVARSGGRISEWQTAES